MPRHNTLQSRLAASEIKKLEGYHGDRQLKLELGLEKGRHEMTEVKREGLRQRLERRDLEVLQLKADMNVLLEFSEFKLDDAKDALQEEFGNAQTAWDDRRMSLEIDNESLSEKVGGKVPQDPRFGTRDQAEKIKSLT